MSVAYCQNRMTGSLHVLLEHDSESSLRLKSVSFSLCNLCRRSCCRRCRSESFRAFFLHDLLKIDCFVGTFIMTSSGDLLSCHDVISSKQIPALINTSSRVDGSITKSRRCRRCGLYSSNVSKSKVVVCCGTHSMVSGGPIETNGLSPRVIANSKICIVAKLTCLGLIMMRLLLS